MGVGEEARKRFKGYPNPKLGQNVEKFTAAFDIQAAGFESGLLLGMAVAVVGMYFYMKGPTPPPPPVPSLFAQ